MKKVQPEEGKSADIVSENIDRLKELFPDAFVEGGVNFDVLRQLLGDASVLDEGEEKYGLNWHGKKKARQIALTPSSGTLLPCPEESVDWGTTKNIFIEGDNLEVLKLLQKSYANSVDAIYIDPPYNTDSDFIYPDRYSEGLDTYLRYTGQKDEEGEWTVSASGREKTGRRHTNWLNMMMPRIKIARTFLTNDGVILISIDDNEVENLVGICNEVFGEENFVAKLIWEKGRKNDAKLISNGHDYILIYAKNKNALVEDGVLWREAKPGAAEIQEAYLGFKRKHGSNVEKIQVELREFYSALPKTHPAKKLTRYGNVDSRGVWRDDNMSWPGGGGPTYDVIHPKTGKPCKVPEGGWRYSTLEKMKQMIDEGRVEFRNDHTEPPIRKTYLVRDTSSAEDEIENNNSDEVGIQVAGTYFYRSSLQASNLMLKMFGRKIFDNPKDHEVLQRWINYVTRGKKTAVVMDYFAGSGTTGHSVMEMNAKDGGTRSYILVQLPEPLVPTKKDQKIAAEFCDEIHKPRNIAELTKERLRRSALLLREEADDALDIDVGFKVFKLSKSNIRSWGPDRTDLEESLLSHQEHLAEGRTEQDVLYELLLKRGVDLAVPIDKREICGKTMYSIGYGVLFACLDESITKEQVEDIGQGIVDWYRELSPSSDTHVFFRDSAFRDDVSKTNMAAILEQNGITHVRSL